MIKVAIVDDDETVLEQARACIEGIDDLPEDTESKGRRKTGIIATLNKKLIMNYRLFVVRRRF